MLDVVGQSDDSLVLKAQVLSSEKIERLDEETRDPRLKLTSLSARSSSEVVFGASSFATISKVTTSTASTAISLAM